MLRPDIPGYNYPITFYPKGQDVWQTAFMLTPTNPIVSSVFVVFNVCLSFSFPMCRTYWLPRRGDWVLIGEFVRAGDDTRTISLFQTPNLGFRCARTP
jgi:hypothetical protein